MVKIKALSPIIATVLLILLVSVLASIVFMWGKSLLGEEIEKMNAGALKPAEVVCDEIRFNAQLSTFGGNLEIENLGNIPIFSFDIKEVKDGDSVVKNLDVSVPIGSSATKPFAKDITAKEIIIFPKILGSVKGGTTNKPFTCLNQGKKLI